MDNPMIAVPIYKVAIPDRERIIMPMVRKMIEIRSVNSTPNFCPNLGAKGEQKAKASKGSVVIIPANVFEICKFSRIRSTKGPTEIKGARKLTAIKIILKIMTQDADCLRTFEGDSSCCSLSNWFNEFIMLPLFVIHSKIQGLM